MTHDDPPTGPGPHDPGPHDPDDVRRLDRELAVANDVTPDDDPRDDDPGVAPPPDTGRATPVSSAHPRET